jgi:hypothetical protein
MSESINRDALVAKYENMALPSDSMNLITGTQKRYLPYAAQLSWFREEYPTGRIEIEVMSVKEREYAQVCCRIYTDMKAGEREYLSAAVEERWYGQSEDTYSSPLSRAETAAVSRALSMAGFGCQFAIEADRQLPAPVTTNTETSSKIITEDVPMLPPGEDAQAAMQVATPPLAPPMITVPVPSIVPSPAPVPPSVPEQQAVKEPMTKERALSIKWPFGGKASSMFEKTLQHLLDAEQLAGCIKWLLADKQESRRTQYPELTEACHFLIGTSREAA